MWMSQRIHSVGTSRATRIVLSRLRPIVLLTERFGEPARDVVADDRKRRGRGLEMAGKSRPESGRSRSRASRRAASIIRPLAVADLDAAEHAVGEHRQARSVVGSRADDGTSGGSTQVPSISNWPGAERGVDGEDLAPFDPADRPALGDLLAAYCEGHVEVEGGPGLGEGEVLGGRPGGRAPGCMLESDEAGTETASPVEEFPGVETSAVTSRRQLRATSTGRDAEKGAGVHDEAP